VSVAAAVVDQAGRLLTVRRRVNVHWEPPGGVLELDETIPAGLVREVREGNRPGGRASGPDRRLQEHAPRDHRLVFRSRIVAGEPSTSNEAVEVARLLDALNPGPAAIRAHDGLSLLPT